MPRTRSGVDADSREETAARKRRLDLFHFVPFRLNRLAAGVSSALSGEHQARYGLDIPEWRVSATPGFSQSARTSKYLPPLSPAPKSPHSPPRTQRSRCV